MGTDTVMDSRSGRGAGLPFAVRAIVLGVPALGALFGVIMLAGGILQLPQAKADLTAFRADASCAATLAAAPAGACHVRDAVAITVTPSNGAGGRAAAVRD